MKHAKPDYEAPSIVEIGSAEEQALAAIRLAFARLEAAGGRITITRLLEEVRKTDQKTPAANLNRAIDAFTRSESR